jgi:hypothetical protein
MVAGLEEVTYGVVRIGGRMVNSHTTQMRHELWANVGPQQLHLENELLATWPERESIGRRPLVLGIRSEDLGGVARATGRPDRLRARRLHFFDPVTRIRLREQLSTIGSSGEAGWRAQAR